MLKKGIKIFGLFLLVLVLLLLVFPVIFKKQIANTIKDEINSMVNGHVEYTGLSFSLLQHFPNPSISMENFLITGGSEFKADTVVSAKALSCSIDLCSIWGGHSYRITSVNAVQPQLRLKVDKDGHANWDIMKFELTFSKGARMVSTEKKTSFTVEVNSWKAEHALLSYENDTAHTFCEMNDLNATGAQEATKTGYELKSNTNIGAFTYSTGGINYLNHAKLNADVHFTSDTSTGLYTFNDNQLEINNLHLQLGGTIKNADDGQHFDIAAQAKDTSFKALLSLFPFTGSGGNKLTPEGKFSFSGKINGLYRGNQYPAISVIMKVENGALGETDFKNISWYTAIAKPQGLLDSTVISSRLHIETAKDSCVAALVVTTPATDANIRTDIKGNIVLSALTGFLPVGEVKYFAGLLHVDVHFAGRKSDIDKKNYKAVAASGNMMISGHVYQRSDFGPGLFIREADLTLHPDFISLDRLSADLGSSDFSGNGTINHIVTCFTEGARLAVILNLHSEIIALRELITAGIGADGHRQNGKATGGNSNAVANKMYSVSNVDVLINANVNTVTYDQLILQKLIGQVEINNGKLTLHDIKADLFGGSVALNSVCNDIYATEPTVNFGFVASNMDIQQVCKSIKQLGESAPSLQSVSGSFSGELKGNGKVNVGRGLDYNALIADGKVLVPDLKINELPILMDIARMARVKSFEHLEAKNIQCVFHYSNGKTIVDDTDIKFTTGTNINFKGTCDATQNVDADVALSVPVREFGQVGSLAQNLLGSFMKVPENMQFKFKVTGKASQPVVKVAGVGVGD